MSKASDDSKKDDPDVIDNVAKKYFSEIEQSVPHMQQVLFDLQNECYKTWKNAVNANISLQKEFLDKSGLDYAASDSVKSFVATVGEEALKYRTYCKNIAIANIDSAKQNAKTLNDNAELYADVNRRMMNFWMSAFFPKKSD
jgi:hypothetical protein